LKAYVIDVIQLKDIDDISSGTGLAADHLVVKHSQNESVTFVSRSRCLSSNRISLTGIQSEMNWHRLILRLKSQAAADVQFRSFALRGRGSEISRLKSVPYERATYRAPC